MDGRYNENGLRDKQQAFCDEYLKDRNPVQAALRAGYSESTAKNASRWLDPGSTEKYNGAMAAYIAAQEEALRGESIADAAEVRRFLTRVMRGQEVEQVPLFVDRGMQELATTSPGVNSRIRAAELLGKLMGLFTDQVRVDVLQMPKITVCQDGSAYVEDAPTTARSGRTVGFDCAGAEGG